MNTFQLSCFLAVANTLSFAKAAEKMNISQPAITHQIKALENELNVPLFRRTTRLVEITPEGQSFLSDAQSMVAIAAQAKLRFHNPEERPVEKLAIGCGSYTQLAMLTDSLKALGAQYPNLHPHLVVVPHEQLYALLENGTVDVIFNPLAQQEQVSMAELKEQSLIFCNQINLIPDAAKLQWELAAGKGPAEVHFCTSVDGAMVLMQAGFGVAVIPEFLVPRDASLTALPLSGAPEVSFGMFYKPYPGDEVLRKLIQLARQQLSPSGQAEA